MIAKPSSLSLALTCALLSSACGGPSWQAADTTVRSTAADERNEPYFAGPWPDDRRLVDGFVSTRRFPKPGTGSLQENIMTTGDKVAKGWGLSAPMYLPLSGALNVATLPETPAASTLADASVFLVAVAPKDAPDWGVRRPIDFHFYKDPTLYLPGNVLSARPFPGSPLEPKTTYALVVTTQVKDSAGKPVGSEQVFWNALNGAVKDPHYGALGEVLDALKSPRHQVAGALIFTTQPIVDDILALRDWLEAQPNPTLDSPVFRSNNQSFTVFEGAYRAPNMQHGVVPYPLAGGEFRFDAQGTPIPFEVEPMRVSLCVPTGPVPAGGFPVVMYSHGTGGNYRSVIGDICADLAGFRIAAVGIDQVFHGPRGKGATGCFGQDIELCFFNPVNVVGGRNSIRQAALDNIMLRKMLSAASLPRAIDLESRTVTFSADRVGYFGHSQGGLSGAVYAAIDPHLAAAVLSGAGGHLTTTILERTDPINVRALAEGPLLLGIEGKESLDPYHPALALVQTFADIADPSTYGRYWVKRPQGAPKHLYVTSGMDDPYTPAFTAEVMAAAAGLPQLTPLPRRSLPHSVAGIAAVTGPVAGNLASDDGRRVTAVFRQFPGQGHFPVFDDATARAQWSVFFVSAFLGGEVTIP